MARPKCYRIVLVWLNRMFGNGPEIILLIHGSCMTRAQAKKILFFHGHRIFRRARPCRTVLLCYPRRHLMGQVLCGKVTSGAETAGVVLESRGGTGRSKG